jgi:hypothetical protein
MIAAMAPKFQLRFKPSRIAILAKQFSFGDEATIFEAGKRIAAGDYGMENFQAIVKWKSNRSIGLAQRNDPADVRDALRLAVSAKTERAAVAVLTGLRGVKVPVASAILTAIKPDQFTVIDYRALESLGISKTVLSVEFYLDYLAGCRRLARAHKVSLRTLDRALWQWSKSGKSL